MDQRQVYPNLSDLLYQNEKFGDNYGENERYTDNDHSRASPTSPVSLEEDDSQSFGVDLTGKGTNLAGKSFTIAAILGLTGSDDDVMNLSVQERLQNQRQLQNYLYAGHEMQRLNDGFCRTMVGVPSALRQGWSKHVNVLTFLKHNTVNKIKLIYFSHCFTHKYFA